MIRSERARFMRIFSFENVGRNGQFALASAKDPLGEHRANLPLRPTPVFIRLPVNLQTDLHLPRIVDLISHDSELVVVQVGVAGTEYSPIEQVEDLPAEIQTLILAEGEALGDADVLTEGRKGADLRVEARRVTKGVGLRRENGAVQKSVAGRIELVANDRGPPVVVARDCRARLAVKYRQGIVACDCDRKAARVSLDGSDTPAAQNVRDKTVLEPAPPTAERQLVERVQLEDMGLVELPDGFFRPAIVLILGASPGEVRVRVGQDLRECVVPLKQQPA